MKRVYNFIICIAAVVSVVMFSGCGSRPSEKLLIAGTGWDRVAIVDRETKAIVWEHMLESGQKCNSVAYLGDGVVMFGHDKGVEVVNRDHELIWKIDAPKGAEMQTARLLPDGNCLLAWNGKPLTILEVDAATGEVLHTTTYNTLISNIHRQTRQVNKLPDGNYLVPLFATEDLRIVSPEGKLLGAIQLLGTPFSSYLLENGNYMVPCGDAHMVLEVDITTGQIVRGIGEVAIPGVRLSFAAGMAFTERGTTYLCNWTGHDTSSTMPQIVEIDEDNNLIWSLNDRENIGQIADVSIVSDWQ